VAAVAGTVDSDFSDERATAVSARLADVLGARLSGPARQLSSGASRETWALRTDAHGELIAQLEGPAQEGRPAQAPVLRAAAASGVPVAAVIAAGADDGVLGMRWTVTQALTGTTDPEAIVAGEGVPAGGELLDSVAAALAAVHRIPAEEALAPVIDDPLAQVREQHDALGQPHPVFELAFRELRERPPPERERSFVHGDFRVGNLMVDRDGVRGVLDWELAHLGNPISDLGWLCVPAWRFERQDRPAGGLGTRAQLLDAYGRCSGVRVELEELRWWELFGTLRWGVICEIQAFTHLSGARHSIEHAVIGRRACEVEWDLLGMLSRDEPGASAAAAVGEQAPPTSLHDRPTVDELLQAARRTLGDEVLPLLDGRPAFQLRVTMRTLGIVARELALRSAHERLHADALSALDADDDVELAVAICSGRFDGREAELLARLRPIVRAKLEVANPRYLESA
jgi:aminoglycoside phosphotransferase (APT) family kinase protein